MTQQDKGKNIFQQAVDSVSNRDEKAAVETAMKKAQELEQRLVLADQKVNQTTAKLTEAEKKLTEAQKKITDLTSNLTKSQAELSILQSDLTTQKNRAVAAEQRLVAANETIQKHSMADQAAASAASAAEAEKSKIMTEHTLKADESLSHLALKYYGSAYEPYWRVIYEANKALIGDNPGRVRPGMVVKIPVLPEELKKK